MNWRWEIVFESANPRTGKVATKARRVFAPTVLEAIRRAGTGRARIRSARLVRNVQEVIQYDD